MKDIELIWYLIFTKQIKRIIHFFLISCIRFCNNMACNEMMEKQLPGCGQTKWWKWGDRLTKIKY